MRFLVKVLSLVLFFCASSFAGFFLEEQLAAPARTAGEVPPLRYGAAIDGGFYLNSPDVGADVAVEYRLSKSHSLDVFAGLQFGGEMYEIGSSWRFFFGSHLEESGHDDYLRLAVSGTYFDVDDKSYFPLRISFGYGRDFLFLQNADFLCRLEVRGSYLVNESYSENSGEGLVRETTHFIVNISFGVYFF